MSAFVNDRDALIQATVPRYSVPLDRALILSASATLFEVSAAGVPTPATITFSALLLGAAAEIVFATEPQVHLTVANGDAVLKFEDMTSSIVTVTAYAVVEGLTYLARQTVSKQQLLDLTPPPAPTGLAASGTSTTIALHWNAAPGNYNNLSHTEVWRAPVNDFAQAVLAGRADGREYIDAVGPGATRYYWIRYISRAAIPGPYNASSGTVGASSIEVEHLLEVLTGELREQQLYADLGARIDLIDAPDTLPGSVAARIRTERTVREEEDAALSESITQVSAAAGENTAAIEEEALVRATETGELYAQYTIKQDVNGYVSGYGLATTANNAAPTSAFAVRADTFYIASPSGPGVAPSMPFIVRTTESVIDGVTIPIGVYMADAFIQNASITNAKIGGDIWSSNWSYDNSGWYLGRAGDFYGNNVRLRGSVAGGAFNSYAWPASGTGFYLGPEGLLLGNYASGRYFQVFSNGDISAPGFFVTEGVARFSGVLVGASGSFTGNLAAASGTLGTITAGYLQNATNTTYVNLNAVGGQTFLYAGGGKIRLNADGSGAFARVIISEPNVVKFGKKSISVGWRDNTMPFTEYVDTGEPFSDLWYEAPSATYIGNATLSGGLSESGGLSGYVETTVVVGGGLYSGAQTPVGQRIYLRVTWTPGNGSGRINPASIAWKLVKV